MRRPRSGIGAELVPLVLILACLAGSLALIVAVHRRASPPTAPRPAVAVAAAPAPPPAAAEAGARPAAGRRARARARAPAAARRRKTRPRRPWPS